VNEKFGNITNAEMQTRRCNLPESERMKSAPNERSEQEIFDELEKVCASSGYVHVLAFFSLRDNMVSFDGYMTSKDMAASYAPYRTVRTEFSTLLGLMMKHPIDFGLSPPQNMQALIDRTNTLLAQLHDRLGQPMVDAIVESFERQKAGLPVDEATVFARGDVLREPIFYGGESAYSFQYRDFALERYAKDDPWLRMNKGFGIAEAYSVARTFTKFSISKVLATLPAAGRLTPSERTVLPGFSFALDEIAEEAGIAPAVAEAVLAAFTAPEPPTNADFKSLGDFNAANAFPILRSPNGEYVLLQMYGIVEALYDSPFYWMAADKAYKDKAFANRGAFTEELVAKRLSAVFGADHVHRNVNVMRKGDRVTEADVLVLFADRAIVVQCKSKKLTLEARKGNDLRLRDDFKKSVQDAYDQAHLCAVSLGDSDLKFVGDAGGEIAVPALREIYPICVVSDHYPALTMQASEFLNFLTDDAIRPPLVADVFLIDVLAEMLASPLRFLSYLDRRVNYGARINSNNELVILGYHLRQNLWVDAGVDMLMIADDCALDLDTAMTVRREGISGERTPKGILTRLEGSLVGRIIAAIEHSTDSALIDLGFMLLTLGSETQDDIGRGLDEIARQTRQDGLRHDFTFAFGDNDSGLTVHCGRLPNATAAELLMRHCELRKYRQRAGSWFGLVVRADDGLPKFGVNLRFPWKQDDALDEATKGMPLTGSSRRAGGVVKPGAFKPRKIGRNELCPCGSGKKFKKCCMP
jgi:hypothetical protein